MFKLKLTGLKERIKSTVLLYDDIISSSLAKGDSLACRVLPVDQEKVGIDFVGSYYKERVTFYYVIQSFPRSLILDFKNNIRHECREAVRANFLNILNGHHIDWESAQMKSRLRVLSQVGQQNDTSDVNSYNLFSVIGSLNKQKWIEDSLEYLAIADKERNRQLMHSSMLMMVSGNRGIEFNQSVEAIEKYATTIGLKISRVMYDIPDILRHFSPFSRVFRKNVLDQVPRQVLTDEIAARYSTYTQGTLGRKGIYWGTDVYSHFPAMKVVKTKEDKAENWLITAETGGGKSYLIKMLILQLLALGYYGTIMDVEGNEYTPIANFMRQNSKVLSINMAEGEGSYFDPVEIPIVSRRMALMKDGFKLSKDFTIGEFRVLLGKNYEENASMENVVEDMVMLAYSEKGVTEEPSTWGYSKDMTLHNVYQQISKLYNYRNLDEDYTRCVSLAATTLSRFFEKGGTRASIFKRRIRVEEIVSADLVHCSFGMEGRSVDSVDKTHLNLMQLSAAQISHQRSVFSKAQGRFNFKVWEEFQRWGKFPGSENTIGVAATGGRKLGDVNIIITNAPGDLMRNNNFDILGNITSYMIGAIADAEVRSELCRRLSIMNMLPELDAIAKESKIDDEKDTMDSDNDEDESPLTYAFLCGLDRSKFGIVKALLPSAIRKSDLFKTGVNTKKRTDQEVAV